MVERLECQPREAVVPLLLAAVRCLAEPHTRLHSDYDGPLRNTFDSHRLLSHAYAQGGWEAQLRLLEELFPHYFERRGDPG